MDQDQLSQHFSSLLGSQNVILPHSQGSEDYSQDMADYASEPLIILQPETTEQVSQILTFAKNTQTPVVARGAGTSLTGASSSHGGIVIDFSKHMNRILQIDKVNYFVHCEAGVVLEELNKELKKANFFFPPDPSSASWCTVGGAIAENSGGMRCFRYGTVKDWVYALRVVLADGSVAKFGEALPKNRVGYDLVHLVCGSEGTLAIITEAWLKILPIPQDRKHRRMLVFFDAWSQAGNTICELRAKRIQPVLLEFVDRESLNAVNVSFEEMKIPEHEAMLFLEADSQVEEILEVCKRNGSVGHYLAQNDKDEERLYNARALVYLAVKALGFATHTEDVVVPIDRLVEYLDYIKTVSEKYKLRIPTGGHAGDGNVHPVILYDRSSQDSTKRAEAAFADICSYALQIGGSVTGEHGVGEQKISYAAEQIRVHNGEAAYEIMKQIKKELDPQGILNPGKFLMMKKEDLQREKSIT